MQFLINKIIIIIKTKIKWNHDYYYDDDYDDYDDVADEVINWLKKKYFSKKKFILKTPM